MRPVRLLRNTLLLCALAACGCSGAGPGDSGASADSATDSTGAAAPSQDEAPIVSQVFRGQYYRMSDTTTFRPCGSRQPLRVTGTPEGRYLLDERFRLTAFYMGRPLFGVFRGVIRVDTLDATAADSGRVRTERVFFITGLDSLRVWRPSDCGGARGS